MTISPYDQDRQKMADANQAAENMETLRRWLSKNPSISGIMPDGSVGTGTKNMFTKYLGDRLFEPLTEADFADVYNVMKHNPRFGIARAVVPTKAEQEAELIDEICDLLKSKDGTGRDGKYSNFDIQSVRVKMQANQWTIQKLTERRDEILREQALNKVPLSGLKKLVHDSTPEFSYPVLPRTTVPRGEIQAVPLDAKFLRSLEAWELRRYIKIYGPNVNKRLAGQD